MSNWSGFRLSLVILSLAASTGASHSASELRTIDQFVSKVISGMPEGTVIKEFNYDPEKVKNLEISNSDILERIYTPVSHKAHTLELDILGDGFLVVNGTDNLLCNIREYEIRSCFLNLRYHNEVLSCRPTGMRTDGPGGDWSNFLVCTKDTLKGTGLYAGGELYFLNEEELILSGYLPTSEYVSGWGFGGGVTLESPNAPVDFDSEGIFQKCVTIAFTPYGDEQPSSKRTACERYGFDAETGRFVHVSGKNSLGDLLMEVYEKEIRDMTGRATDN